jgi:hypothetical protein
MESLRSHSSSIYGYGISVSGDPYRLAKEAFAAVLGALAALEAGQASADAAADGLQVHIKICQISTFDFELHREIGLLIVGDGTGLTPFSPSPPRMLAVVSMLMGSTGRCDETSKCQ